MKSILAHPAVPLYYEIVFDAETFSLSFVLHPKANDHFLRTMRDPLRIITGLEQNLHLSTFTYPQSESFGFGDAFRRSAEPFVEEGWATWTCILPQHPDGKKLREISASIWCITTVASLLDRLPLTTTNKQLPQLLQFLTIDEMVTYMDRGQDSGAFGFTYSKQVLDFCATIWDNEAWCDTVLGSMVRTYAHLTGEDLTARDPSFVFDISKGDTHLPYFKCPGNCACVHISSFHDAGGAKYCAHNVDTKMQQLTLLAGIITLANLAIEHPQ
ncbi:MAG: hypothetical protein PHT88_01950 [Candidatus Moranbacteria bacterium]|nr:hypothetical protein [Candidatus Moranbacteria bacterium]